MSCIQISQDTDEWYVFCENGHETYDFINNNKSLDQPKDVSFSRKPLLHDARPYLNENTFLVNYKTNRL